MISQQSVETVRNTVDLLSVVEQYVDLKKQGSMYVGLSPFNHERTPSFKVQPDKQIWYDFSSGQGGDAFAIMMKLEGLTFVEAVEKLAEEYGITLEYENESNREIVSSSSLEIYSSWCMENLKKRPDVLEYLSKRGVSQESIDRFEIGYSPSSNEVVSFIRNSVINEPDAIKLGIIDTGDNGLYARFIDRLMFPIRNHTGKLCGFSGRTLGNHPAKYVNTKETPLFHKSFLMYGFNIAKEVVSKKNFFVLTEGQLDVVMMHQVGLKYTFASMGTSLTKEHVKVIKRYADKGLVAYDGDRAGIEAAFKAAELFIRNAVDVKIIMLDDGEDPADLISSQRGHVLVDKLKNGIPAIKFCIDRLLIDFDLNNPFDKTKAFGVIEKFSQGMLPAIQTAVIEEASSRIGPIKIKYTENKRVRVDNSREKELIKAAITSGKKEYIDEIVSIKKCFSHKDAIDALAENNNNHEVLAEILLDDLVSESKNFKEDIKVFKIWCLKRFLASITSSTKISLTDKLLKTREVQKKIQDIEKGVT